VALPPVTGIDQPWPPSAYDPIGHKIKLWSAWFSGDPDQLSWAYYNLGANSPMGRSFFRTTGEAAMPMPRSGQYRGGLLGNITRTFWGQSNSPGEKRTKLHVPIAGDIASMSADLLFAKRPVFEQPDGEGNQATADWLENLFDDRLHATFLNAAEVCAALSGVYLRTVYDQTIADEPWIEIVHPDAAVPVFRGGRLVEVTFWRVIADNGTEVARHLENHVLTDNTITHAVYVGDQEILGAPVPLTDFPETAPLVQNLTDNDTIYLPDLGDANTVAYVPNMLPNRIWRDIPEATSLGRSDYTGVEQLMDALDETYSTWAREIRLTKSRLIVPPSYLDPLGAGKGAVVDVDKEIYVPMNILAGVDATGITPNQFTIRWEEYKNTCEDLIEQIVTRAGYSQQTFGETATTAMTATEVEARERRTLLTRAKKLNYWRPALADIVYTLMCLSKSVFGADITPMKPDVTFPDAVLPSTSELAQTVVALETAQAASLETKVTMVHPDWTKDQVAEEVAAIRDQLGMDLFNRARLTLSNPMNNPQDIGQQVQDIEGEIVTPTDSNLIGASDVGDSTTI
jgi:A118 family predicted phage portal protein